MTDNGSLQSRRIFLTQITAIAAAPMLTQESQGATDGPTDAPCSACEECTSRFCRYKRRPPSNQR